MTIHPSIQQRVAPFRPNSGKPCKLNWILWKMNLIAGNLLGTQEIARKTMFCQAPGHSRSNVTPMVSQKVQSSILCLGRPPEGRNQLFWNLGSGGSMVNSPHCYGSCSKVRFDISSMCHYCSICTCQGSRLRENLRPSTTWFQTKKFKWCSLLQANLIWTQTSPMLLLQIFYWETYSTRAYSFGTWSLPLHEFYSHCHNLCWWHPHLWKMQR